eukprot:2885618-Pleurochrysis_carterae.AAC.2
MLQTQRERRAAASNKNALLASEFHSTDQAALPRPALKLRQLIHDELCAPLSFLKPFPNATYIPLPPPLPPQSFAPAPSLPRPLPDPCDALSAHLEPQRPAHVALAGASLTPFTLHGSLPRAVRTEDNRHHFP